MKCRQLIVVALFLDVGLMSDCLAQGQPSTCTTCHAPAAAQLARSEHASLRCQECHGGGASYELSPDEVRRYTKGPGASPEAFEHGPSFTGVPSRFAIPELCGNCHAHVERMNPFGLRTDRGVH